MNLTSLNFFFYRNDVKIIIIFTVTGGILPSKKIGFRLIDRNVDPAITKLFYRRKGKRLFKTDRKIFNLFF